MREDIEPSLPGKNPERWLVTENMQLISIIAGIVAGLPISVVIPAIILGIIVAIIVLLIYRERMR